MIVILTGVPGTGKDTIAAGLANQGFVWLSINEIVEKNKLWKKKEKGCLVVNLKQLENEIRNELRHLRGNILVEGHLACEIKVPAADACIVLRTNPEVLRKRLEKRKYPREKIEENILCEELDYCTQKAESNLRCPVYEVRTDKSVGGTIKDIKSIIGRKGKWKKFKAGWVDWSKYLLKREKI